MASDLFKKYVWLADTIRRAGPISFAEIRERWEQSSLFEGKPLALRTFHNHREAIDELFGIRIVCNERTNCYYIANTDELQTRNLTNWLLDSFSIGNMLHEAQTLQSRVLVEAVPSAKVFLTDLLEAMHTNRQVVVIYQPFTGEASFELTLRPLFVKLCKRRWYLYADKPDDAKIKLYALDRMLAVRLTDAGFEFPTGFSPEEYLSAAIGAAVYDDIKPCTIRIRGIGEGAKYLRTLPLHASQREIAATEDYTDFELQVAPTYEFYQAVLARFLDVEVLSPLSVRDEIERMADDLALHYHRSKRRVIFLDFDGVLNTKRHNAARRQAALPLSDKYGYLFDPASVSNLQKIVDATEASIVITSSWRLEGRERMEMLWHDRKLPGFLLGITGQHYTGMDPLNMLDDEDPDAQEDPDRIVKGVDIDQWLMRHAPLRYTYVILDDENDLLPGQQSYFIRIDPHVGITEEDARRAIRILKNKP